MKKNVLLFSLLISGMYFSQVGVNVTTPKATLDVVGKKGATDLDGVIAPRLTRAELTSKGNTLYGADQNGAIIYITDVSGGDAASQRVNVTLAGYYYFDSSANVWRRLANMGDEPWRVMQTTNSAANNTQNIYQNANVGVGDFSTITASEKLDVNGNARIRTLADGKEQTEFLYNVVAKSDGTLGIDQRPASDWKLSIIDLNSRRNNAQTLPSSAITTANFFPAGPNLYEVPNSAVTMAIPSGKSSVSVMAHWESWFEISTTGSGTTNTKGNFRFYAKIQEVNPVTGANIGSPSYSPTISMQTFLGAPDQNYTRVQVSPAFTSFVSEGLLTVGKTYRITLACGVEQASPTGINAIINWGIASTGQVYYKD